jgi:hypothetical protein
LAEKGLAWIAGIALAMGAIYLVSIAAQSAWFTAPVRLASALVLGAIILGVSEWTRRIGLARPPGHPLVSSLLAGAGVVVFYATTWAAHGIYQFIDWPAATFALARSADGAFLPARSPACSPLHSLVRLPPTRFAFDSTDCLCFTGWRCRLCVGDVQAGLGRDRVGGLYFWFFAAITADDVCRIGAGQLRQRRWRIDDAARAGGR